MGTISDSQILFLFRTGHLVLKGTELWKYDRGRKRMMLIKPLKHEISGRIKYQLQLGKSRRTIYRNKLVWIEHHKRIPGDRMHIDHINGNNTDDRIENLRELGVIENCRENTLRGFEECREFFRRRTAVGFGSRGDF